MKEDIFNKYSNLSNYFKLATVLLIDAIPVWVTIVLTNNGSDSDFLGWGLMMMYLFFFLFNIWAFIVFFLTMLINKPWLRDILFYFLLFLYLFLPVLYLLS